MAPPIGGEYLGYACNIDLLLIIRDSGFAAHYASWRIMQAALGITGFMTFVSILLFFPETSQPGARGIDKLQLTTAGAASRPVVFINPFKCLLLLRSPNLLAVVSSLHSSLVSSVQDAHNRPGWFLLVHFINRCASGGLR